LRLKWEICAGRIAMAQWTPQRARSVSRTSATLNFQLFSGSSMRCRKGFRCSSSGAQPVERRDQSRAVTVYR